MNQNMYKVVDKHDGEIKFITHSLAEAEKYMNSLGVGCEIKPLI